MTGVERHYLRFDEKKLSSISLARSMRNDWRDEVFRDLTHGGKIHWAIDTEPPNDQPAVILRGSQYFACASLYRSRLEGDTLYVFDVRVSHSVSQKRRDSHFTSLSASWQLAKDLDKPAPGTPIRSMHSVFPVRERGPKSKEIAQPASPRGAPSSPRVGFQRPLSDEQHAALQSALREILARWGAAEMLPEGAALPGETGMAEVLLRLRGLVARGVAGVSITGSLTSRTNNLLGATLHPGPEETAELHAILGMDLLAHIHSIAPNLVERALSEVVALPPDIKTWRSLVHTWISSAPPPVQRTRAHALTERIGRLPEALRNDHATWLRGALHVVDPLREPLVDLREPVPSDPPDAAPAARSEPTAEADIAAGKAGIDMAADVPATAAVTPALAGPAAAPVALSGVDLPRHILALRRQEIPILRHPEDLVARAEDLWILDEEIVKATGISDEIERVRAVRACAEQSIVRMRAFIEELPTDEALRRCESDARDALARLVSLDPRATPSSPDAIPSWAALERLLQLASRDAPSVWNLPLWIFRELHPDGGDDFDRRVPVMLDPRASETLRGILDWAEDQSIVNKRLLKLLPTLQPGPGDNALERLRSGYEGTVTHGALREAFEDIARELGEWTLPLWDAALHPDAHDGHSLAPADLVDSLKALDKQRRAILGMAPKVQAEIGELLASPRSLSEKHGRLERIEAACESLGPAAEYLPKIELILNTAYKPLFRRPAEGTQRAARFEIYHVVSTAPDGSPDGSPVVRAARLVFRQGGASGAAGDVYLPFAIRADGPADLDGVIEIEHDARTLSPIEVLVAGSDWHREAGTRQFLYYGVGVRVPVNNTSVPLEVKITLRDRSGADLATTRLTFAKPMVRMPDFAVHLADSTDTKHMRSHPLGIQSRYEEYLRYVREGQSSFMIAAPRRFGKTTFVRALLDGLKDSSIVAIKVDVPERDPITSAFSQLCNQLDQLRVFGSTDRSWSRHAEFPQPGAFDNIRRRARELGKRAIYVFFDEAQFLFAGADGESRGTALKNLMDGDWGVGVDERTPIRVVLVGQLHLQRLVDGNLGSVLGHQSIVETELHPMQIWRFLDPYREGADACGMQSDVEARELLTRMSSNFYVLKAVVIQLQRTMREEHRTWFLRRDVQRAIDQVINHAVNGNDAVFLNHTRDPLNGSDILSTWQPVRAYPVAVAWAVATRESPAASFDATRRRATELLEQWSAGRRILSRNLDDCLKDLRDASPLLNANGDGTFRSELIQDFLARIGRSGHPFPDQRERLRLSALSLERIELPEDCVPQGAGGQATVFTSRDGRAYRRTAPLDADEAARFVETCHALQALEGTRQREESEGYRALPVTTRFGFEDDALETRGIVVYHWIPGKDLAGRLGAIPAVQAVRFGCALASALVILELRRIVHRDIKPENIVLGGTTPCLIDFGLARLVPRESMTTVANERYVAPEARRRPALWSSKADVYALATTLRALVRPDELSDELRQVLDEATVEDPEGRSSPSDLRDSLKRLAARSGLTDEVNGARRACEVDVRMLDPEWARRVAERHIDQMTASRVGVFDSEETLMAAAHFLDDVFGGWHSTQPPGTHLKTAHLTAIERALPGMPPVITAMCTVEHGAVGQLRHGWAHRDKTVAARFEEALRILNQRAAAHPVGVLRSAVVTSSQRIERDLRVRGVAALVARWIGTP